ncbi:MULTISPECIES: hypothetical protein [Prochlorococcus]|nr:hypothetical protein [Prochlorococcus marinus]
MKGHPLFRSCQRLANSRFMSIAKDLLNWEQKFSSDNAIGVAERLTAK